MPDPSLVAQGWDGAFVMDDNGDIHGFLPSIAIELIQRGIIYQSGGRWRIHNEHTNILEKKYTFLAVCDFCSARPVVWDVDADSFKDASGGVSTGGWAACEPCGQAIADGNREQLLQRILCGRSRLFHSILRENQRLFWLHYRGIRRIPARSYGH
jgi:hypothetical protein